MSQRTVYLCVLGLFSLSIATCSSAEQGWFNPDLLGIGDRGKAGNNSLAIDEKALQRLANGQQLPGTYSVDVYFNANFIGNQDTTMTADGPNGTLTPAWSVNTLLSAGLKSKFLTADKKIDMSLAARDRPVSGILNHVAGAIVQFDFVRRRLDVSVPELYMNKSLAGATDPHLWQDGINASIVDYNFSFWKRSTAQRSSFDNDSAFLSLNNGINLGAWRLHNFSTWSYNALVRNTSAADSTERNVTQRWQAINTWIDRPIPSVMGLLSIGDRYTPSDVFDSIQFRGVQLATDEEMFPDILRDFAPVIRGTATSNARVTVRQNGNIIYETTVPPGPFTITDVPSASLSGDMYVTVRESNGAARSFIQGSSSVAVMQREHQLRYAFTGGRLRSSGIAIHQPQFLQATAIYGLPYDLTIYGGLLGANDYKAGSIGLGSLLGVVGALSADVTMAKASIFDRQGGDNLTDSTGQSWRLRYAKSISETGSTLTLAAYRYSTNGYYSFADANAILDKQSVITTFTPEGIIATPIVNAHARQEMQINFNQSLGDSLGSLGLSATHKNFWDLDSDQESVSANWNFNIKGIGVGVGYQLSRWPGSTIRDDRMVSLMVTLPLSQWLYGPESYHNVYTTTTASNSSTGIDTLSNTVGGTLLTNNRLGWSAGQTNTLSRNSDTGNSNSGNLNLSYNGMFGKAIGGYSYAQDSKQLSAGLQGVVVATHYGMTLGQSPGETMALLHAEGASGVQVKTGTGIATDWWGNAVVPAQPYRRNRFDLDLLTTEKNVTLNDSSMEVIPTRGAVIVAEYGTTMGHQVLITLTNKGKHLPFGAMVTLVREDTKVENKKHYGGGIVGDAGQAWLTGIPDSGILNVKWGDGADSSCHVRFAITEAALKVAEKRNLPVAVNGECA